MNDFEQAFPDNDDRPSAKTTQERRTKVRRWLSKKRTRWMLTIGTVVAVIGLTVGLVVSGPTPSSSAVGVAIRLHLVPWVRMPAPHRPREEQPG
jgi:hypothetical protein